MNKNSNGVFIISLDFEKYWGVRDKRKIEGYGKNLKLVDTICKELLSVFTNYNIHTTWSTVGFLAFENKKELLDNIPSFLPSYKDTNLSPYNYINNSNLEQKFHFSSKIISEIVRTPNQELSTHTFSHYYCLEEGQDYKSFDEDLKYAVKTFKEKFNVKVKTIILPRNQINSNYFPALLESEIEAYRGNERNWIYNTNMPTILKRAFRLIDSYVSITGSNVYDLENILKDNTILNIPSSRLLRPVSKKNTLLKKLRLKRIKNQMLSAAKKNKVFHLWWHPHNFGNDLEANLSFLKEILDYFKILEEKYGMASLNMKEVVDLKNEI